jgi:hypothetical protein
MLVPLAGRYLYGHHNIAWELRNDERLGGACGYVDRLVSEISESPLDKSVISSEDFEYLVQYPLSLREFVRSLRRVNVEPTFMVFFRETNAYLNSLARELAKHGFGHGIEWYEEQLQRYGGIHVKKDWWFDFNRARFAERWIEITEAELICIDYDESAKGEGVLPTYVRTLGGSTILVEASRTWHRLNTRAV